MQQQQWLESFRGLLDKPISQLTLGNLLDIAYFVLLIFLAINFIIFGVGQIMAYIIARRNGPPAPPNAP